MALPSQAPHLIEVEGRIDFGELRPGESASAEISGPWGMLWALPTQVILSHDGGVGELRYPVFLPDPFVRRYYFTTERLWVIVMVACIPFVWLVVWVLRLRRRIQSTA